jgi:hypothetical protein
VLEVTQESAVAIAMVTHLVLFVIVGAPVALAIREKTDGWGALLVDTLAFGLVLLVLGVTMYSWLGWLGVALVAATWVAMLAHAIARRTGLPGVAVPRGREWVFVGAWIGLAVVTIVLRFRSVNFLPWVGDMGAYVNWANEFARTGELNASWPPYFSSFLSISTTLFGDGATTAAVGITGLVLVVVLARLLGRLGVGRWIAFTTSALLAISLHGVWFATFPGSESLNAPLFLLWLATVVGALRSSRQNLPVWLVLAGVLMVSLGLLRGTAPLLLIPLIATAAVATTVGMWRDIAQRVWLVLGASLVGALVTYWYGILEIPRYYVDTQVRDLVPGSLFGLIEKAGLFEPTVLTAAVLAVVTIVLIGGGWLIAGRRAAATPPAATPTTPSSRVAVVLGAVLASAMLLGIVIDVALNAELIRGFLRAGIWLLFGGIAVIAVIGRSKLPHWVILFTLFIGSIAALFLAIQSYRLKIARGHAFFLYWDRYLFSELIPLFYVLFGLLLAVAWLVWGSALVTRFAAAESRRTRAVPAVVAAVALALVVVPTVPQVHLATSDTYMAGAWSFEQELIAEIPTTSTPVLWSATTERQVDGWFFPNTWMAFAKPLERSYGYDVLGIHGRGSDFAPDLVLDDASLAAVAVCAKAPEIVVFETQSGGTPLDARVTEPGITLTTIGEKTSDISVISQPPTVKGWTKATITVKAWLVRVDPALAATISCPA